jgi:hypothetical protein
MRDNDELLYHVLTELLKENIKIKKLKNNSIQKVELDMDEFVQRVILC